MTTSKALRSRNMTAAKRSLKLILEGAEQHQGLLEEGTVPEASFAVHALSYDRALAVIRAVDALDGDQDGEDEVCVSRDALTVLVELLRNSEVGYLIQDAEEGSPLDEIIAITGTGEPAPSQ